MDWSLPVSNGSYEVYLYFAEIWPGAFEPGKREFGATVENLAAQYFDVFAEVGPTKALVKRFDVTVSDGELNINFERNIQNPSIKGIEVRTAN